MYHIEAEIYVLHGEITQKKMSQGVLRIELWKYMHIKSKRFLPKIMGKTTKRNILYLLTICTIQFTLIVVYFGSSRKSTILFFLGAI